MQRGTYFDPITTWPELITTRFEKIPARPELVTWQTDDHLMLHRFILPHVPIESSDGVGEIRYQSLPHNVSVTYRSSVILQYRYLDVNLERGQE